MRRRMVAVGFSSRFPSTISYSSRPSSTAPRARTESGNRRLRGLVERGLYKMIIGRYFSNVGPHEFDEYVIANAAKHRPRREDPIDSFQNAQYRPVLLRPTFHIGWRHKQTHRPHRAHAEPWRKPAAHLSNRRIPD